MGMRKGFVYTLEAIIASTMVLGVALAIPNAIQDQDQDFESVERGLQTLDDREALDGNASEIEGEIEPYISEEYNYSVRLNLIDKREGSIESPASIELDEGYKKLLLWVESAEDLEINFRDQSLVNSDETGYKEIKVGSESGQLEFSGSMDLDYEVQRFYSNGTVPEGGAVFSRSFTYKNEDGREVQVILWQQ